MLLPDFREQSFKIEQIANALSGIRPSEQTITDKLRMMKEAPLDRRDASSVSAAIYFLLDNELRNGKLLKFEPSILNPNVIVATIDMTNAEVDDFPIK